MRRVRRLQPILALTLALTLWSAADVLACPNCKEAVAAQPSEILHQGSGYNWSVLLMLAMPFALLGTGGLMVARAVKRGTLPEM
jgi:hypothetical protein